MAKKLEEKLSGKKIREKRFRFWIGETYIMIPEKYRGMWIEVNRGDTSKKQLCDDGKHGTRRDILYIKAPTKEESKRVQIYYSAA